MKRFLTNLYGAIQLLINPNYLKEKVERIHSGMEMPNAIEIVAYSVYRELDSISEKYPLDEELKKMIHELRLEVPEDKEELKTLILKKQEVERMIPHRCEVSGGMVLFPQSKQPQNK